MNFTLEDFFSELSKLDPSTWYIIRDGHTWKHKRIRLRNRYLKGDDYLFCPLTAVAFWLNRGFYHVDEWRYAAAELGLSKYDTDMIQENADCNRAYDRTVRVNLLACLRHIPILEL